ncbi:MAG: hypothetical protein KKC76_21555 [Proteobacteria bacterium]|nr:hypothetical protein [Pseudomonadota bacterium]
MANYTPTDQALKDIKRQDWVSAFSEIHLSLSNMYVYSSDDQYALLQFIGNYPEVISIGMVGFFNNKIEELNDNCKNHSGSFGYIYRVADDVDFLNKLEFAGDHTRKEISENFISTVRFCVNTDPNISLDKLNQNAPRVFPEDILRKAFDNHISKVKINPKKDLDYYIIAYVKSRGPNSEESKIFFGTLEDINWLDTDEYIQEKLWELNPIELSRLLAEYYINDKSLFINQEALPSFIQYLEAVSKKSNVKILRKSIQENTFKDNKYLRIKFVDGNTYNLIKLNKYQIGARLFDETIRKIVGNEVLPEIIRNDLYGYNIEIVSSAANFLNKADTFEGLRYSFFIPKKQATEYAQKDIAGQDLIDSSTVLLNDERVKIKLQ